jgi:hypothetical protein
MDRGANIFILGRQPGSALSSWAGRDIPLLTEPNRHGANRTGYEITVCLGFNNAALTQAHNTIRESAA